MMFCKESDDIKNAIVMDCNYSFIEQVEVGMSVPFVLLAKDKKILLPNTDQ